MAKPSTSTAAVCLLSAVIGAFFVYFSWHREYADLLSDSAIYLLLASKFSLNHSIPDNLFSNIMTEYHLPPGYSIALALAGGGAHAPTLSHIVNALFLTSGVTLYFLWVRTQGTSVAVASSLAIIFSVLPATLYFSNFILSEHLYIPLSLLGLLLLERSSRSPGTLYPAALVIGLTIITRSVGLALLPALLIIGYRINRRVVPGVLLVSVAIPLVWFLYKSQYSSYGYIASFIASREQGSIEPVSRLAINLQFLWLYWIKSFDHDVSLHSRVLLTLIALPALLEWVKRLGEFRPDAIYVGMYLGIVLVWPHASHIHRFLFPLLPLLLFYAYACTHRLTSRYRSTLAIKLFPGALLIGIVVVAVPTQANVAHRVLSPAPAEMGSFSRSHVWLFDTNIQKARINGVFLNQLYKAIRSTSSVAKDECIWSIDPARHMLLSSRISREAPSPVASEIEFTDQIEQCRYVFSMNAVPYPNPQRYDALYPEQRLGQNYRLIQIVKTTTSQVVSKLYEQRD